MKYPTGLTLFDALIAQHADLLASTDLRLLHGDLSSGNIIWAKDGVKLIDWEGFRLGPPADDIGYLITDNNMPPDIAAEVMQACSHIPHLETLRKIVDLKNCLDDMSWVLAGMERERLGLELACADRPNLFSSYYEGRLHKLQAKIAQLVAK